MTSQLERIAKQETTIRALHTSGFALYQLPDPEDQLLFLPNAPEPRIRHARDCSDTYCTKHGFKDGYGPLTPPNPWLEQELRFATLTEAIGYTLALTVVANTLQFAHVTQIVDAEERKKVTPEILGALRSVKEHLPALEHSAHYDTIKSFLQMDLPQLIAWTNDHRELMPYCGTRVERNPEAEQRP